jgi:hypothetical protein
MTSNVRQTSPPIFRIKIFSHGGAHKPMCLSSVNKFDGIHQIAIDLARSGFTIQSDFHQIYLN